MRRIIIFSHLSLVQALSILAPVSIDILQPVWPALVGDRALSLGSRHIWLDGTCSHGLLPRSPNALHSVFCAACHGNLHLCNLALLLAERTMEHVDGFWPWKLMLVGHHISKSPCHERKRAALEHLAVLFIAMLRQEPAALGQRQEIVGVDDDGSAVGLQSALRVPLFKKLLRATT
jgi:hypothetical protein